MCSFPSISFPIWFFYIYETREIDSKKDDPILLSSVGSYPFVKYTMNIFFLVHIFVVDHFYKKKRFLTFCFTTGTVGNGSVSKRTIGVLYFVMNVSIIHAITTDFLEAAPGGVFSNQYNLSQANDNFRERRSYSTALNLAWQERTMLACYSQFQFER